MRKRCLQSLWSPAPPALSWSIESSALPWRPSVLPWWSTGPGPSMLHYSGPPLLYGRCSTVLGLSHSNDQGNDPGPCPLHGSEPPSFLLSSTVLEFLCCFGVGVPLESQEPPVEGGTCHDCFCFCFMSMF